MKLMPGHLEPIVSRVAKHEAGHYVVARRYGFRCGDITATILDANGTYQGGSEIILASPIACLADVIAYLKKRVQILYAGALSESLTKFGKVDNSIALACIRESGKDDYSKAREHIHLLRNLTYPSGSHHAELKQQLNTIDSEEWNASAQCVETDSSIIEGLAARFAAELMTVGLRAQAKLAREEIDTLPAIIDEFGACEESAIVRPSV